MKVTKIITKHKGKFQSTDKFIAEYENELNYYLSKGYEIKSSNMTTDKNFAYIYTLLEKENGI